MDDVAAINDLAVKEGWYVCDSDGSLNGPWQLCSFNEPEEWPEAPVPYPFASDDDAWLHVMQQAERGGVVHMAALVFLRERNRMEFDAIVNFYRQRKDNN